MLEGEDESEVVKHEEDRTPIRGGRDMGFAVLQVEDRGVFCPYFLRHYIAVFCSQFHPFR